MAQHRPTEHRPSVTISSTPQKYFTNYGKPLPVINLISDAKHNNRDLGLVHPTGGEVVDRTVTPNRSQSLDGDTALATKLNHPKSLERSFSENKADFEPPSREVEMLQEIMSRGNTSRNFQNNGSIQQEHTRFRSDAVKQTRQERENPNFLVEECERLLHQLETERQARLTFEAQFNEAQNQLNEAITALGEMHTTDNQRRNDDQLCQMVKALRYDIRAWSANFQNFKIPKKTMQSVFPQSEPFQEVTPVYRQYMTGPTENFPLLVQGFIWQSLLAKVFDQDVWAGGPCQSNNDKPCRMQKVFTELSGLLEVRRPDNVLASENYHTWLSQSSRLVAERAHPMCVAANRSSMLKEITKALKSFSDRKDIFGGSQDDDKGTLAAIIKSAVDLDCIMAQQRACLSFRQCYGKDKLFEFNPELMDAGIDDAIAEHLMQTNQRLKVYLFKAPGLEKVGNNDGKRFDQKVVLLKAEVDCRIEMPQMGPQQEASGMVSPQSQGQGKKR